LFSLHQPFPQSSAKYVLVLDTKFKIKFQGECRTLVIRKTRQISKPYVTPTPVTAHDIFHGTNVLIWKVFYLPSWLGWRLQE